MSSKKLSPFLLDFLFSLCVSTCLAQSPGTDTTKPRIYVTDSDSWQMKGGGGGTSAGFGGGFAGGASPQTAEIVKTFGQRCPEVLVNNRVDRANYVVRLEHEGGKGLLAHKDKVVVFIQRTGDSIFSASTLSVGGSVQGACKAILDHWSQNKVQLQAPEPDAKAAASDGVAPAATSKSQLSITSTPAGADIEINGAFVGSTPSTVEVDPGKNDIKISKKGFAPWTRTLVVKSGTITISAELDPSAK